MACKVASAASRPWPTFFPSTAEEAHCSPQAAECSGGWQAAWIAELRRCTSRSLQERLDLGTGILLEHCKGSVDGDVSHARDVQTLAAVLQQRVIFLMWASLGAQVNVDPGVLRFQSLHNATLNGRSTHGKQAVGRSYGRRLDRGLYACDRGPAIYLFFSLF